MTPPNTPRKDEVREPDIVERLHDADQHSQQRILGSRIFGEAADEIERLRAIVDRTMTDHQRLLWRDDVEGICPTPGVCWEYGDTARCGPCAIKQASKCGVEANMSLPNLPEVYRLRRQCEAMRKTLTYYANAEHYDGGDVPGHIYVLDDHGRYAREILKEHPRNAD